MTTNALPKLRPLTLAELLDQAIRIYRRNFLTFIAIIAAVQIPIALLNLTASLLTIESIAPLQEFQTSQDPSSLPDDPLELFTPGYFAGIGGTCILAIIALVLVQGVATAALTRAVGDHYLGRSTSFADAYRRIGRSWLRLVGAFLLAFLISIGLLLWWILAPCIGWFTGLGMIIVFGQVIMPLVIPIIVLENQTVVQAVRRAWDLTRRRFWWLAGFVVILYLLQQVVVGGPSFLIAILFELVQETLFDSVSAQTVQTILQALMALAANLIYLPLQLTIMALVYFDLRVRTEGFDLTLLAGSTVDEENDVGEIMAQVPPPETTSLVTWTEMGHFALLSLGVGALYAALYAIIVGIGLAIMGASGGFPRP